MSTDMQRYSIENQIEAIALYAARHGFTIVRSYEDAGRSGVRIGGRQALKNLIDDVRSGRADYSVILVYDVSRWGRFQDTDESAYYEFICKDAGVAVKYCAEQFENDGSLTATVLKNIKRAMAGEYSRELSVKVWAGQSRIAAMGFNVGSAPGYGLRRVLVDEHGNRKMELVAGQRKNIKTERIILVRGPARELETVAYVYDLFLDQKNSINEITRILNAQEIPNVRGCPWNSMAVRQLLSNEKYIGSSVYNRGSKKLGGRWKRNPRSEWILAPGAFEAVVSKERFETARRQLKQNASRYTDNEMLDFLTAIWCRDKCLSRKSVEATPNAPRTNTFRMHFGGLMNAYRRIGFKREIVANRERSLSLRRAMCKDIVEGVTKAGGIVRKLSRNAQLRVNEELTISFVLGRAAPSNVSLGQNQWQFGYRSQRKPDILIVARIDDGCSTIRDYFVLPFAFLPHGAWLTVSGRNYWRLDSFRTESLAKFYELCARQPMRSPFK